MHRRHKRDYHLLLLGMLVMAACATKPMPESSLTGQVFEVNIDEESVTPNAVTMQRGDEVRWRNQTKGFVDVSFLQSLGDIAVCRKGFMPTGWGSGVSSSGIKYMFLARVASEDHAGLCLSFPGTYQYAAELDEATTGKTKRMHGTITIQ